jgi:hypothetical protein
MKEAIINLLAWERYIPVMTEKEQRDIMQGVAPTATQLAEWSQLLTISTAKRDAALARAYAKL